MVILVSDLFVDDGIYCHDRVKERRPTVVSEPDEVAKDVKELRNSHVLFNKLGSDEEVANLFNEIGTDLVFNFEIYEKVIKDIEEHYNSKTRTWMAQVYHAHFSSPWSIVAFFAAFAVLAMTGIQTWRAFFPPPGPCDGVCDNLKKLIKTSSFCDYLCYNLTVLPASCVQVCKAIRSVWK